MAEQKEGLAVPNQPLQDDANIVFTRAKGFWEKFSKPIIYVGASVIVLIAGFYGYKIFYSEPRELKAADAIWHAQRYFKQDSIQLALNGDSQYPGFEKIVKNYGDTKVGNLAKFYAGVCALRLGDFKKSVKYLESFSTDAIEIQTIAYARLADAYAELGNGKKAIELYVKAAHNFPEHDALSSENLFRAGVKSQEMGKTEDAIKYFKEIRDKYSRTEKGYQIEKQLAKLGVVD